MTNQQRAIIQTLGVKAEISPEQEIADRIKFLKTYLKNSGLKGFVLGISGGQDSLLAGTLAQKTVEQLRQDGYNAQFHAVLLPYGEQADADDARLALDFIKPDKIHEFNIKASVDAFAKTFQAAENHAMSDVNKGNAKARMRMVTQYAVGFDNDLLVIGTDHAAEAVTGFFTKFGDGACDITPLSGLNKCQGRQLLKFLGAPERLCTKQPTADLLDKKPGQTDEADLGLSYQAIDDYLEGKQIDPAVAEKIERRYAITQHKREQPVAFA